MTGDEPLQAEIKTCLPHQLGWLHRPELDRDGVQVWEKPDGQLWAHDPRKGWLVLQVCKGLKWR